MQRWFPWLGAATAGVVLWRVVAVAFPHTASSDPQAVRWAAGLMGLWFIVWGLWTFHRARTAPSLVFAGYGLTAGLHWGGPIGIGSAGFQNVLLAFYIVVSSGLNSSLFLHLAIVVPPSNGTIRRRVTLLGLYLPPLIGVMLTMLLAVAPSDAGLLQPLLILFPVVVLFTLIGGGLWIRRLIVADSISRWSHRLPLVVAALILGWLPHAFASTGLGPGPEAAGWFNLPFAVIPVAIAFSLACPRAAAGKEPASAKSAGET
ncbi:MAG: hypothetical protein MPN21_03345 [Thermoanaerobaculia bacterium]|nr:hypothetical protein [Thermoanaerobaculia bacterium]